MPTNTGAGGQPQEYDAQTGEYGGEHRQNTSHSAILAEQKRRDAARIYDTTDGPTVHRISGAISGALNPESERAHSHAKKYYLSLRKRKDDVAKVAKASGYSEEVIQRVKSYLFIDAHNLGGKIAPFHPDYDIAESWRRLSEGKPFPHDFLLINHEVMEMALVEKGFSQQEAHDRTNKKYNYREAVEKFNEEREKDGKS